MKQQAFMTFMILVLITGLAILFVYFRATLDPQGLTSWREPIKHESQNTSGASGAAPPLPSLVIPTVIPLPHRLREGEVHPNQNIFLLDTAGNPHPNYRAWCAVESWSRNNPEKDVWMVMTAGEADNSDQLLGLLLHQYPNLQLTGINVGQAFLNTPLDSLYTSGAWKQKGTWPVENLADMLRVAVLWHWGGVYADTEVISINPFTLPGNSVGFATDKAMGNALYSFTHHHPMLHTLMTDMTENFKVGMWGSMGPQSITRVMVAACGGGDDQDYIRGTLSVDKIRESAPITCNNVTVYPHHYFFPVPYSRYQHYLKDGEGAHFDSEFKDSLQLHFFNKMTKAKTVRVGSNSIYEVAAKRFCPVVYHQATKRSETF